VNYAVQSFNLAVDRRGDAAEPRMQGGGVLQVVALPAGAQDVALAVDDGDFVPITGLLRLEFRSGAFSKLTLRNAPTSGTLQIYAGTEPIPFVSGGAGAAVPDYDVEVTWPALRRTTAIGGAWDGTGQARQGVPAGTGALWAAPFGAGSSMDVMLPQSGWVCGRFLSACAITLDGLPMYFLPDIPAGVPTSWAVPPERRVYRCGYVWRQVAGVGGAEIGVGWTWSGGTVGNFLQGCIRLRPVGAGMVLESQRAVGAPAWSVALAWPVPLAVPVYVEWLFFSANGARPGVLELWVNNVLLFRGSWTNAALYPYPVHAAVANANKLIAFFSCITAGNEFRVADLRFRSGAWDHYGVEVP
jgi:hypothetical protein